MLILHDTLIKFDSINYTKQPPENLENSNMILFTLNTSSGYEESSFTYLCIKIVINFPENRFCINNILKAGGSTSQCR